MNTKNIYDFHTLICVNKIVCMCVQSDEGTTVLPLPQPPPHKKKKENALNIMKFGTPDLIPEMGLKWNSLGLACRTASKKMKIEWQTVKTLIRRLQEEQPDLVCTVSLAVSVEIYRIFMVV